MTTPDTTDANLDAAKAAYDALRAAWAADETTIGANTTQLDTDSQEIADLKAQLAAALAKIPPTARPVLGVGTTSQAAFTALTPPTGGLALREYDTPDHLPAFKPTFTGASDIVMSVRPDAPGADMPAFKTWVPTYLAGAAKLPTARERVIVWHEADVLSHNMSDQQYVDIIGEYSPVLRAAGIKVLVCYTAYTAGVRTPGHNSKLEAIAAAGLAVDGILTDAYFNSPADTPAKVIDPTLNLAAKLYPGTPQGLAEIGVKASTSAARASLLQSVYAYAVAHGMTDFDYFDEGSWVINTDPAMVTAWRQLGA